MSTPTTDALTTPENDWRISSFCGSSGCVEIALADKTVRVRDSKDGGSPVLRFDRAEWRAFVDGVKAGEFDL